MRELQRYIHILDSAFNKPPRNVPELTMEVISKYPCDFLIYKDCGVMIVKLGEGVYNICNMAVRAGFQKKGLGSFLMDKIHTEYKGLFILKTSKAQGFYKKYGYTTIAKDKGSHIMVKCTDPKKVV